MIAEGVEVPAQKATRKNEHPDGTQGVDHDIHLQFGQSRRLRQPHQQGRQQKEMKRQVQQHSDDLATGHTDQFVLFDGVFFAAHAFAFLCSSYSRFIASSGVSTFRSVFRSVSRISSACMSAKLI